MRLRSSSVIAVLGLAAATVATERAARAQQADRTDEPASPHRLQDQVFFGFYGGTSFATARRITHEKDDGTATTGALGSKIGWAAGHQVAWWPCDWFGAEWSIDVHGFGFEPDKREFERCELRGDGECGRPEDYSVFGISTGPTLRLAAPLRWVQPNVGGGFFLPLTIVSGGEPFPPESGTGNSGASGGTFVAPGLRFVGGLNVYTSRQTRILLEYRLDAHVGTDSGDGNPGRTLDVDDFTSHLFVAGISFSPDFYRASAGKPVALSAPGAVTAAYLVMAVMSGLSDNQTANAK